MFAIRHFSLSMAGAACALALGIAVPAAAQPSAKETRQAHNVLVDYSICVADAEPDITRTFVLTDGADAARVDGVKRLFDSRCMGFNHGKLKMEDFLFRGALAQRLIEKTLASDALDNVADIEALNATYAGGGPAAQGHTLMYRIGECIARAEAAGARTLFATRMGSDKEKAAIRALAPVISGCVPAGQEVQIDRARLRFGLATMYYRLAARLTGQGAE